MLYYLLWYFLTGLPMGEAAGYTFLIVMIYEVFEMSFGLLVTAVSPDLKFAGLVLVFLVTIFNWFNGVVVPYQQIQGFWRYWVCFPPSSSLAVFIPADTRPALLPQPPHLPLRRHDHRSGRRRRRALRRSRPLLLPAA